MTVGRRAARPRWAPGAWVLLLALAGAAVVTLSWMAPEPAPQRATPEVGYQHVSYTRCAADAPPNYGTRSVSDIQCVR